jgi:hypothetical protein
MSFIKSIKAMSLGDLQILEKSLKAQLSDVKSAIRKHEKHDDDDEESDSSKSTKSTKSSKTAKKPAVPRKPTAWAAWTKAAKELYSKEYLKESETFRKAHDGKLAGGKGVGGFAVIFAKMMREKHVDDYAEFEADIKSAAASASASASASAAETSDDDKPPAKKVKNAKPAKKPTKPKTDDEAEESKPAKKPTKPDTEVEELDESAEEAPIELKNSDCTWRVMSINNTKYSYESNTRGCWHRNDDKTRGEWAGLYDPETKKLNASATEINIINE